MTLLGGIPRHRRVYAGGLTKLEPKEMERLWIQDPDFDTLVGHEPLAAALDA